MHPSKPLLRSNFGITVSNDFGSVLARKMLENLRHRVRIFLCKFQEKLDKLHLKGYNENKIGDDSSD